MTPALTAPHSSMEGSVEITHKKETSKINVVINGVTYTVGIHFKERGETLQDKMKRLIAAEAAQQAYAT